MAYLEEVRIIAAWCKLRESFRHFRADRNRALDVLSDDYPGRRDVLRKRWQDEYRCQ
jgi:predicted DNA-binding transcriptional regulator YafY